jgi:hypothetical protein
LTLSDFILSNLEEILGEWESFAGSIPCAKGMDSRQLRNTAERILVTIAQDMARSQTDEEQEAKSKGRGLMLWQGGETAAEHHASTRLADGFDLLQMVSDTARCARA